MPHSGIRLYNVALDGWFFAKYFQDKFKAWEELHNLDSSTVTWNANDSTLTMSQSENTQEYRSWVTDRQSPWVLPGSQKMSGFWLLEESKTDVFQAAVRKLVSSCGNTATFLLCGSFVCWPLICIHTQYKTHKNHLNTHSHTHTKRLNSPPPKPEWSF